MKAAKLRESDVNELRSQDRDIQEQLFRLRLQINMGQTDGVKKYRVLRKDRARILTLLRERELAAQGSDAKPGK
jgi:large subunit ribosomal protein L29